MANKFAKPRAARDSEHSIVYRNETEFAGWPFLCGFWKTAEDHLVAGFNRNDCVYSNPDDVHHDILSVSKSKFTTLRSTDRGRSWDPSSRQVIFDMATTADEIAAGGPADYAAEPPLDFTDRNVLIATGATPAHFVPDARAWLRASTDGGRTWRKPMLLPLVGLPSLTGHGSAMVRSDGVSLLFLTAVSADGWTRRPLVYASLSGGVTWTFLSFITPTADDGAAVSEKKGTPRFGAHRWFYPRGIPMPDGRIVLTCRSQRDPTNLLWTEMFESLDGGRTWGFLSRVNDWGAPGDLVAMQDGRLVCVYGYRLPPFGIRARVSEDGGRTWGSEIVLRDDGGSWDLGYPRVVEHEKGKLLSVYYMNLKNDPTQMGGGVRHIAQTIFTPD
jgi:hypothetical protein